MIFNQMFWKKKQRHLAIDIQWESDTAMKNLHKKPADSIWKKEPSIFAGQNKK